LVYIIHRVQIGTRFDKTLYGSCVAIARGHYERCVAILPAERRRKQMNYEIMKQRTMWNMRRCNFQSLKKA
jgi:hypothetical protein